MTDSEFKPGDRVRVIKPKSVMDGLTGEVVKTEGAHLSRVRPDELEKTNPLYQNGLMFFNRELRRLD